MFSDVCWIQYGSMSEVEACGLGFNHELKQTGLLGAE